MSLRTRIVLAVAVVFAVVSGLTVGLLLSRAEASLRTAFDRTIQTRADWLLSLVSVDPVVIPLPSNRERMRITYRSYGLERELFRSPDWPGLRPGRVARPLPGFPPRRRHHPNRPDERLAFGTYRYVTAETRPDQLPDDRLTLTLGMPDQSLHDDIRALQWRFGLGWLLSLLLASLGGYVVAGWLLRPIQTIVRQAGTISSTDTIDAIALPTIRDELYELTDALNRMLARLRESAETQQHFFGAAAHELRTPLTVMRTGLDVMLGSGRTNDATTAFMTGQLDEVKRLTRLIDEFLTLSRPAEGRQPLTRAVVDVTALLQACLRQLTTIATDYDVTIVANESSDTPATLLTDAVKLEHVLLNLLENAVKYAVPDSEVRVTLNVTNTALTIRTQNQTRQEAGPTDDLLQPYFRADPLRDGHGLGLWISHRLATLLGGTLRLQWQQFTFISTVTLPIVSNQPVAK